MAEFPVASAGPDPSYGIFETMRIENGGPVDVDQHLMRLYSSLERCGWPYDADSIAALIGTVAGPADARIRDARIRIECFPDGSNRAVLEEVSRSEIADLRAGGIVLKPIVVEGGLGDIKWIDRRCVSSVVGADDEEALVLDSDMSVLETGRGNLFVWMDGEVLTPPTDGRILPGVTRKAAMTHLRAKQQTIGLDALRFADHVVATGTVRGALWVKRIDGIETRLSPPDGLQDLLAAVAGFA